MTAYVVDVKPSARRTNGAVGTAVNREGARRRFADLEAAESWARALSERGPRPVWIRAANPNDRTGADAYLVGRRPRRPGDPPARSTGDAGEQATLPAGGATERR